MQSVNKFLDEYEKNDFDETTLDPITLETQSEYFQEAKQNWPCLPEITCIMKFVRIMVRTVQIAITPAITVNPWLVMVVSLPNVINKVNTKNFFRLELQHRNGEFFNSGFLVCENPVHNFLRTGAGKHFSCYLMSKKTNMFHLEADLAMWAAVVHYIMREKKIASWMCDELKLIENMCKIVYCDPLCSWNVYVQNVKSENYKLSLVQQHPDLNPSLRCPHLNKFVFACFMLRNELNARELTDRRNAVICEYFGRYPKHQIVTTFFSYNAIEKICDSVLKNTEFELFLTSKQSVMNFQKAVQKQAIENSKLDELILSTIPSQDGGIKGYVKYTFLRAFEKFNPEIDELNDHDFQRLFLTGIMSFNGYERNLDNGNLPNIEPLRSLLRTAVRNKLAQKSKDFGLKLYENAMKEAHAHPPILINGLNAHIFKSLHNRDLNEEYKTTIYGLSKICCMCPSCPFFKKKTTGDATGNTFDLSLLEHISNSLNVSPDCYDLYMANKNSLVYDYFEFEGYFIGSD